MKKYQLGKLCLMAKYVNRIPIKINSVMNNLFTSKISDVFLINIEVVINRNISKGIKKIKPYIIKAISEPKIPIKKMELKLSVSLKYSIVCDIIPNMIVPTKMFRKITKIDDAVVFLICGTTFRSYAAGRGFYPEFFF